jgi:hypothetical protein
MYYATWLRAACKLVSIDHMPGRLQLTCARVMSNAPRSFISSFWNPNSRSTLVCIRPSNSSMSGDWPSIGVYMSVRKRSRASG